MIVSNCMSYELPAIFSISSILGSAHPKPSRKNDVMKWLFKEERCFEVRCQEAQNIRQKYPDRVPVIVEKAPISPLTMPTLDTNTFLAPADLTVAEFTQSLRRRIRLLPGKELYLLVNHHHLVKTATMGKLYKAFHDEDKFLYISYSGRKKSSRSSRS